MYQQAQQMMTSMVSMAQHQADKIESARKICELKFENAKLKEDIKAKTTEKHPLKESVHAVMQQKMKKGQLVHNSTIVAAFAALKQSDSLGMIANLEKMFLKKIEELAENGQCDEVVDEIWESMIVNTPPPPPPFHEQQSQGEEHAAPTDAKPEEAEPKKEAAKMPSEVGGVTGTHSLVSDSDS